MNDTITTELLKTGVDVVGHLPWGTHFCLFYETKSDLLETLVPYCKAGLENGEFCLWVVSPPVTKEEATEAIRQAVPDFDRYLTDGSIEIVSAHDWYLQDGTFDLQRVIAGWKEKLARASAKGYAGVRVTGDTAWLVKKEWKDFCEYEESLNEAIANQRLAVLCTYPLAACGGGEILDVIRTHQFAVAKRRGGWEVIETASHKQAKVEINRLNEELEQRVIERTSELSALNQELATEVLERQRAEEAARRSEKELRDVIETIPAMAFSIRPDGSTEFVNQCALNYTGLSADTISGTGWQSTIHPDDRETHLNKWLASLATGEPFENEVRHRSAAGEYRWFLVRAVPMHGQNNRIVKWYGTLTDIEDRKRAESRLAGEKRILEMVAKGDSLAEILDSLCRLVEEHASGALASILLLEGDRLRHGGAPNLPKAYTDAIDGAPIGPAAGSCGTAAYRGKQVIVEDIASDALWVNYRDLALPHGLRACWSTPVFSSQGKVIATFAIYHREPRSPSLHDQEIIEQITHLAGVAIERKLTHDALHRSEAYLADAQRLTHIGSWAFDHTGNAYLSEETLRIWGFDPRHRPPDREAILQRIHPEDRDWVLEHARKALREKRDYTVEFRVILPDGALKHIHALGHHIFSPTGEFVEAVGTHMDVTERKRAEQERERLRQLETDLAHIHRVSMLGELAASLAHEVKQPITAAAINARTSLRWLQREPPQIEEARESASRVVSDVHRAADIIDRVRSLYTRGVQQREPVDVNEVIEEIIILLRNEAWRHSIAIHSDIARNLPKIMADRVQLQQVFLNLMLNGIEAMKETAGELKIKTERSEDGQLRISVSDAGVGLPSENLDDIFSAFFTTKPYGTGMGLAITRSIVEAHGGRLWAVNNDSGAGATFYFTLPASLAASA